MISLRGNSEGMPRNNPSHPKAIPLMKGTILLSILVLAHFGSASVKSFLLCHWSVNIKRTALSPQKLLQPESPASSLHTARARARWI